MTRITLLTQEACTFCDQAKAVLARLAAEHPLDIEEIRLDSPRGGALAVEHGVMVAPGVLVDGTSFSHGRLSEKKLRRRLEQRTGRS